MPSTAKTIEDLFSMLTDDRSTLQLVRQGVSPSKVTAFIERAHLTQKEFFQVTRLKSATFYHRLKSRKNFDSIESDRIVRVMRALKLAEDILGSPEQARAWYHTEVPALGNVTPWSLLDTEPGTREVETILLRIEHGIYS